jgi:uncharacterized repeat protein (TIGR04138 family)
MSTRWTSAYAAMHRDGAAAFPPACLHYVLDLVRAESARRGPGTGGSGMSGGPLTPTETSAAFRRATRADFGPLVDDVLADWKLETPAALGEAVALLGAYGCLTLEAGDSPQAFATDTVPFREVHR